ncbi:aminotransferase-like domain-containing protein [Seohaeicola zhoushanensis]|uniref:GntR family transcriptional regulator n=1 Tax=Seohaeicola zhoushanensis TaxID=1569283 RepID=A0A8J3M819_9RHOB|nr:PLP-dependent aminotransferase family protein [Seohaeicola zhoushanensis]GHF56562.1 GntR family transcriptional regulator [Seohaeicola zhoushanensis]
MGTIWPELESATGPKYRVLADAIRQAAGGGELGEGTRLPPVRELAFQLGVTPGTVARAYTVLTDEGVLTAGVGRGTFVAPRARRVEVSAAAPAEDVWSQSDTPPDVYAVSLFSPRIPDVGQVGAIRAALAQVGATDPMRLLNYPTRDSYRAVREAVVGWLSDVPLGPVDQEDIVLTNGGQNGICVALQAILRGPSPTILVEDLSYAGFRRAAELLRADVVGVAMDAQGVIPEALEEAARRTGAQVFCTTPEVQNPTAAFCPLERRQALAAVAEKYDLQIIEDDCYRIGNSKAPSYRALAPERGWHVSTLSKTLTPALRVGYALAPRDRAVDLRRAAEYGYFGISEPLAEVTRILLSDPKTRDLCARARVRIGEYVRLAVNALGRFDLSWDPEVPFLWLRLPPGWRAAGFCRAAEAAGVQIRSADEFALRTGRAPHAVRIAVNCQVSPASFENAMLRLRALLDNPPEQISV